MTNSLKAASIVTLIFTQTVDDFAASLTEDVTHQLNEKLTELKYLIVGKFQGRAKAALVRANQDSTSDMESISIYLSVAMLEDDMFAQKVQGLAQDIQQMISVDQNLDQNIPTISGEKSIQLNKPELPTIQVNNGNGYDLQSVSGNQNQVIGKMSGGQIFGNITGTVSIGGAGACQPKDTSSLRIDSASQDTSQSVKTILLLSANPKETAQLRLGEEVREIQTALERSHYRNLFKLEQRWAVTVKDLRRALLDCHPQIVHFSGHGVGQEIDDATRLPPHSISDESANDSVVEGLVLEDESGEAKLISGKALANLFALFANRIECIVLNACYSANQADAITQEIPYVIGMRKAIGDRAAIEFAIGFYDALLAGYSVDFAYQVGRNAIHLHGIPEYLTPVLRKK